METRRERRGVSDLSPLSPVQFSRADMESLLSALHVDLVELWECLVSPGWRLELEGADAVGIHYNLGGAGRLFIAGRSPVDLLPHTLVIVPRGQPLRIEAPADTQTGSPWKVVDRPWPTAGGDKVRKFVAGDSPPQVMLICGYFHVALGASIDLFGSLSDPIVEQFDPDDRLDEPLRSAMAELPIARAFAAMAARPGAPHSVLTLARTSAVSRSAFMARFTAVFGQSPMNVLRNLRMQRAAVLLTTGELPIDSVASEVGYASRSSFVRAFQKTYGSHPSKYRLARERSS